MHEILIKVHDYLLKAGKGEAQVSPELARKFGDLCEKAFLKQVGRKREEFVLRGSNIGRPTCQVQAEKLKLAEEPLDYAFVMKMLIGDMVEAAAQTILVAAGVPVETTSEKVSYEGYNGELDLTAYGKVWDIKSASGWSFTYKFKDGAWPKVVDEGDPFGYQGQLDFYARAKDIPPGGWIAVDKSSGEWSVVEIPEADRKLFANGADERISANVKAITEDAPFKRCFTEEVETFRGKETGNMVLGKTCSFCRFKWSCWPGLKYQAATASKAQKPEYKYYTYTASKDDEAEPAT